MLGRVADDRDDDHADEELGDADRLEGLGDRADEDLGDQPDGGVEATASIAIERRTDQPNVSWASSS